MRRNHPGDRECIPIHFRVEFRGDEYSVHLVQDDSDEIRNLPVPDIFACASIPPLTPIHYLEWDVH